MLINVYDFDNTIYRGDSSYDFFRHCAAKYPRVLLSALGSLPGFLAMQLGLMEKTRVKERFYQYLKHVPEVEEEVERFWQTHDRNLKCWYFEQKRSDDLVISASPEFLLRPLMKRLELALLASRVDPKTGRYDGPNCHGEEKVRRFTKSWPDTKIEKFYSDSYHDTPLARLAKEPFLVRGDVIKPFPLNGTNPDR
ncbi:MAG: haloacid dehalogenase-like hydrolase [Eubacteriales bacterium]|nr:haloacid dehalogenase-like hydrolase [Eubacteriales bacterium]